ncbi:POT family proton-dependent oligopeptide transporter [Duganella sp. 1411]|uniref:peptide MFS transporter n=1 Tax=Duganella sp. 1411 TaxID=2806572 RepID=UPI001AE4866B|nr:peptide MFS transporter [Duganella sp. 1411]MBP1202968.1 POT family proton-dependent oligopeptide transporter [Duganella sp. 1411]
MRDHDTWFGQPKGLTILFLTEMWEKFSFFGMRALQIYYMTKELHFTQAFSSVVFGAYAAGVYLTPIAGGLIADRWLGRRKAVIIGGALMALGHFMMAFEALFFPAMVVIAVGNGLFLPNLPSQVPLLYPKGDPRAGAAFNVYYVGINLGAFLAPLICGTLGEVYGWHYGFGAAGVGMCLGLAVYTLGGKHLPADASRTASPPQAAPAPSGDGRGNIRMLIGVALAVMLFRVAYEQTGNTFAVWADTAIDRQAFGLTIPVTWFQSLNPMFVFLISPLLVRVWTRRAAAGRAVPALARMSMGAIGVGVAYAMLAALIVASGSGAHAIGWLWVVAFFGIFTLAELYILPVGLGLFASLAPPRFAATTIAAWFFCSFTGNLLSGLVGAVWERVTPQGFFLLLAAICISSGVALRGIDRLHRASAALPARPIDKTA